MSAQQSSSTSDQMTAIYHLDWLTSEAFAGATVSVSIIATIKSIDFDWPHRNSHSSTHSRLSVWQQIPRRDYWLANHKATLVNIDTLKYRRQWISHLLMASTAGTATHFHCRSQFKCNSSCKFACCAICSQLRKGGPFELRARRKEAKSAAEKEKEGRERGQSELQSDCSLCECADQQQRNKSDGDLPFGLDDGDDDADGGFPSHS